MVVQGQDLNGALRGGLFLSSMMGVTDGAFCAGRAAGCAMVQLGAYLAEPTATAADMGEDVSSFLPPDRAACTAFLAEECRKARGTGGTVTCLNLATPRLAWGLEAGACFGEAGGDVLELNVHGGYGRYLAQGKLRAMVRPEHREELVRWAEALSALQVPLVVKLNAQHDRAHVLEAMDALAGMPLFGIHVNVRDPATRKPDLAFLRQARRRCPGLLLASGYIWSAADARAAFEAGADAVGIAEPAIADAGAIASIAEGLKE